MTVVEYQRFFEAGGYEDEQYWKAGAYGERTEPGEWDEQRQFPNRPVVNVSWFEEMAYAAWAGARLLTEAQWERAARGTTGRKYPWGDEQINETLLNYGFNVGHPTPPGVYPGGVTLDGIVDMAGNVWQWCSDWHDEYPQDAVSNPTGPPSVKWRVVSWRVVGPRSSILPLGLPRRQSSAQPGSPGGPAPCPGLAHRSRVPGSSSPCPFSFNETKKPARFAAAPARVYSIVLTVRRSISVVAAAWPAHPGSAGPVKPARGWCAGSSA